MSSSSKCRVLILGGVGLVGRHFVKYLLDSDTCSCIRVADKLLPQISFMLPEQENMFDNPIVEFVQADLTKEAHLDRAFAAPKDWDGERLIFDYVFNLAAETRYGQAIPLYESRCTELSKLVAARAAKIRCTRYIEVSTALIYKSQARTAYDESGSVDPWTSQSAAKLAAENEVKAIAQSTGLNYVIFRPAIIYGPGDVNGLMPRIVCAAAYVELKETMKFLWDSGIKINTVHVRDVCTAMWTVAHTDRARVPSGTIFNLCDEGDTDVGRVNTILSELFGIKTGYHGTILSNVARLRLADVVDIANEKHLKPWDTLCKQHKIDRTPLSPFMSIELLDCHHLYINGSKIERETSFRYSVRSINKEHVAESVRVAIQSQIFPPILK